MKQIYLFCLLLLSVFISFFGEATSAMKHQSSQLLVEHAYIRATIPGTVHSSSYMEIENKGSDKVTLLSAYSDISERIEIHQHSMVDGMMRMRKIDSIVIEPQSRVKLQPSGLHLMFFDVKKPLLSQQKVEITLNFSNNMSVTMLMPVYSPTEEQAAQKTVLTTHEHHH
ncbi:copper chaperone PCu(A)C [Colwellia sp. E150_009]|jgi:copper(I)-binding protein